MPKVLITGSHSFIGDSFDRFIRKSEFCGENWETERISLRGEQWKEAGWSGYDAVLHVAGLAHVDVSHADAEKQAQYYAVNRDLAGEAAAKAAADGVRHFILLSSAIVYGDSAPIGKVQQGCIDANRKPHPANFYGDSKLQGEEAAQRAKSVCCTDAKTGSEAEFHSAEGSSMILQIVRIPMVYGKGCKGNFPKLEKLARKSPIFPKIENRRSMIHIDNLCEFFRQSILHGVGGICHPQNAEMVSTSELVQMIGQAYGKKVHLVPGFAWAFRLLSHMTGYVNKIFGNMYYAEELSQVNLPDGEVMEYCILDTRHAVQATVQEIR